MQKMRFSSKQKAIAITEPEDGVCDVIVLTNEEKVVEKTEQPDTGEETEVTYFQYGGNIFRTFEPITESDIKANLDYYLNVKSQEKPTEAMQEYAQATIDNYTASLIESGVI